MPRRVVVVHFNPPNLDKRLARLAGFDVSWAGVLGGLRRARSLEQPVVPGGTLWICWPKKASGVESDLGQAEVRRHGRARVLVDFKVAAIDQTWSGLRFARKKPSK